MGIKKIGNSNIFKEIRLQYKSSKAKLPLKVANTIQNHFLQGFRKGGGQTNASIGGWQKRKTPRNARERKRNVGRALLVRTGSLRSDIKKREVSFNRIVVGTRSTPYAGYINDGTSKMPQREFIGESRVLEKKIENQIVKELDKIFNK